VDDGEDADALVGRHDLVEDAIGADGDLAHVLIAKFRDHASKAREIVELVSLIDEFVDDLPGVVFGVSGDEVVDGVQIGLGLI
jgi:hypothetical protein